MTGLDINVCPTGQVKKLEIPKRACTMDKSISTGIKHCLGLLYKRALFDL